MRETDVAKEIHSLIPPLKDYFLWMNFHIEYDREESSDGYECIFKLFFITAQQNKIIGIANIVLYPQAALYKLIEFVEIDVRKELTGHIAKGDTFAGIGRKTVDDDIDEVERFGIFNSAVDELFENFMIY